MPLSSFLLYSPWIYTPLVFGSSGGGWPREHLDARHVLFFLYAECVEINQPREEIQALNVTEGISLPPVAATSRRHLASPRILSTVTPAPPSGAELISV